VSSRPFSAHGRGAVALLKVRRIALTDRVFQGLEARNFIDDVEEGDLWYFPAGIPHSIQGLNPDGCEFLLALTMAVFLRIAHF
jgi:hypothetical protein